MLTFFHRLKVSQKLALISIFFLIPDTVLLCLFLFNINANIRFAQWEQHGNEYQRPLENLLEHLPNHLLMAHRSTTDRARHSAELATLRGTLTWACEPWRQPTPNLESNFSSRTLDWPSANASIARCKP